MEMYNSEFIKVRYHIPQPDAQELDVYGQSLVDPECWEDGDDYDGSYDYSCDYSYDY